MTEVVPDAEPEVWRRPDFKIDEKISQCAVRHNIIPQKTKIFTPPIQFKSCLTGIPQILTENMSFELWVLECKQQIMIRFTGQHYKDELDLPDIT